MVLDTVITFIFKFIDSLVATFLSPDNIFYIGVGFTILMILFFFIKSAYSYETKLERTVNKLNTWLYKHRTLNEGNLLEFNMLIKSRKTPKILRKHWQQYMLYRDKLPSEYMSSYNCIDKPAKTSSFKSNIRNFIAIYITTAVVTFALTLMYYKSDNTIISNITTSLITPTIIILLGLIFTLVLRAMQNYNLASLYQTFHIFNRYIDKASVTIPKYVDFEILFTKKEIKNGIPILGEYLEKRARQEQEELEEAQRNAVSHEEYDFASSGVDGSLVLERAMKESETYLNFKQRTLSEIQQFESEISTLKKNYENTSKDYQRKLQASKENMERLRQQQEESTNRIEVNYIRKQQQDEVKKQEMLEKDQEDATNKFNAEINSLSQEIEKRRIDIEEKKQRVQQAMENEYQTFSAKLHKTISGDFEKSSNDAISKISTEKDQYAQAITYLKNEVDNKDSIINAKDQIINELQNRLAVLENGGFVEPISNIELQNQPEPVEEYAFSEEYLQENPSNQPAEDQTTAVAEETEEAPQQEGHYDARGYYWFNDGSYYDADGLYHDLEGDVYDEEGNLQASNQVIEKEELETAEMATAQPQEEQPATISEEYTTEEYVPSEQFNEPQTEEYVPTEEYGNPHVEEYTPKENQIEETIKEQQSNESLKEEYTQESSEDDEDGHYDDRGYYWFNDKTYYDSNGLFHDLNGNVYDSAGNLQATDQVVEQEQSNEPVEDVVSNTEENIEEQSSVEEKPRKKAGRPRKERTEEELNKPKRSVGRPRKEKTEEEFNKPKRSVGRPRKEKTEEEFNKPKRSVGRPKKEKAEEELNKPKRSVGRPKKEKTEEELNKPKRSVGRPKKEKSEEELNKPKRSVGRPKKSDSDDELHILKQLGQSLIEATEKKTKKRSAKKS